MSEPVGGPPAPAQWDREALDRILKRAAELQAHERDTGESMTPDEVLALGREVGIPGRYLQQAMLEERVRVGAGTPGGVLDRAVGSAICTAARVVRGDADAVEEALATWMDANELLAVERRQPGRISWEPLRGMQVAFRRSAAVLGSSKRPFMLSRASRITGGVVALEPGYCHVTLTADLRSTRASFLGGVAAITAVGAAASAVLAVMSPFWLIALAPLPMVVGIDWGIVRQYAPVRERTQLGLERALDHLEQGAGQRARELGTGQPSFVGLIAEEIRKALKP
jgi:hypothetical protein